MSNFISIVRKLVFANNPGLLGLFSFSTLILFAHITTSSQLTKIAWITALLGFLSIWKNSTIVDLLRRTDLKIIMSYATYAIIAVTSCIINSSSLNAYLQICLWTACLISGYTLAYLVPEHHYAFIRGALIALLFSIAILLPTYHALGIESKLYSSYRLTLLTGAPGRLALYSSLILFYAIYKINRNDYMHFAIWSTCIVVFSAITYLTNARSCIILLPVSLIIYGIMKYERITLRVFLYTIFCITIFTGLITLNKDSVSSQRLVSVITDTRNDPTFRSRLPIWEAGIWAFKQAPWFGSGIDSYQVVHASYQQEHAEELPIRYPNYEKHIASAHNIVLGRLVDTGLFGTTAFLIFYAFALRQATRAPTKDRWVAAFLLFFLLIGVFGDNLRGYNTSSVFYFLIGITAGRPTNNSNRDPNIKL